MLSEAPREPQRPAHATLWPRGWSGPLGRPCQRQDSLSCRVFEGRATRTERTPFLRLERSGAPKTARRGDCFAVHFGGLGGREAASARGVSGQSPGAPPPGLPPVTDPGSGTPGVWAHAAGRLGEGRQPVSQTSCLSAAGLFRGPFRDAFGWGVEGGERAAGQAPRDAARLRDTRTAARQSRRGAGLHPTRARPEFAHPSPRTRRPQPLRNGLPWAAGGLWSQSHGCVAVLSGAGRRPLPGSPAPGGERFPATEPGTANNAAPSVTATTTTVLKLSATTERCKPHDTRATRAEVPPRTQGRARRPRGRRERGRLALWCVQ